MENDVRQMREQPLEVVEEDLRNALKEADTFVDICINDLLRLYKMAYKHAQLRHVEDVPVQEYMTRNVITIHPQSSLAEAAHLFVLYDISGLPVVDKAQKILGILTEADLLTAIGLPCKHPACGVWYRLEHLFSHEKHIRSLTGVVGDLMYNKPIYIHEGQSLHQAIEIMKKKHVKKLIVTDDHECVSGIITRGNIIRALLEKGVMGIPPSTTWDPEESA